MDLCEDYRYLTEDKADGVTNYLISLYERTENIYMYYPAKLNRLLTIYKLCTLKYNDWCLSTGFIINDDGTMGMPRWTYSPFYNNYYSLIEEDNREITDNLEIFDESKDFLHTLNKIIYKKFGWGEFYGKVMSISDDSKELIELIFRKFGNYSIHDLSTLINEIVSKIPIKKRCNKNYIDFNDFQNFLLDNKKILKDNIVFEFINNFDRLEVSKSIEKIIEKQSLDKKIIEKQPIDKNIKTEDCYEKKYAMFLNKFKRLNSIEQNKLIDYLIELSTSSNSEDKPNLKSLEK